LPDLKDNKKFVILKFERAIRLRKIDRESSSSAKRTQKRIFDDGMVVRCLEKGSQDEKKYFITKVDEKWRAIDLATL
jgi:precorrin-2 methylase